MSNLYAILEMPAATPPETRQAMWACIVVFNRDQMGPASVQRATSSDDLRLLRGYLFPLWSTLHVGCGCCPNDKHCHAECDREPFFGGWHFLKPSALRRAKGIPSICCNMSKTFEQNP